MIDIKVCMVNRIEKFAAAMTYNSMTDSQIPEAMCRVHFRLLECKTKQQIRYLEKTCVRYLLGETMPCNVTPMVALMPEPNWLFRL